MMRSAAGTLAERRLRRERLTIERMVALYCRGNHGRAGTLCAACRTLLDYALDRLDCCLLAVNKPSCGRCPVHCFKPGMRKLIQAVMAYAGPRMLFRHPLLAVMHLADQLRGLGPKRTQG